jgi:hypothetical protein
MAPKVKGLVEIVNGKIRKLLSILRKFPNSIIQFIHNVMALETEG